MKTLHLTLKKKWFDMIASGEKKEEYREIKPYWQRRLHKCMAGKWAGHVGDCQEVIDNKLVVSFPCHTCEMRSFDPRDKFTQIVFKNGYSKNSPTIVVECIKIEIGKAKPEWSGNWQGDVFIIKLGKIINHA